MHGGGNFTAQNKILPGAYINFISAERSGSVFGERGRVAIGLSHNWGGNEVIELDRETFGKNAKKILGYSATDEKVRAFRELFQGAKTVIFQRLNKNGAKATKTEGTLTVTATKEGSRGNDLAVTISAGLENTFTITTKLGTDKVDEQVAKKPADVKNNDFVAFHWTGTSIAAAALIKLSGGSDGTVNGEAHTEFLSKLESRDFNILAYDGTDNSIKELYIAYTKRLRDELGIKFQTVLFKKAANYEGVINVTTEAAEMASGLIYFTAGKLAGAEIQRSLTNETYTGEYTVKSEYTMNALKEAIKRGEFVFHKVGEEYRALSDVNSLTEEVPEKSKDFKNNQVIRVLDQIGKDIAAIFNSKYLGKVQNNKDGQISLWSEIVKHANTLQNMGAIRSFQSEDVEVLEGEDKDSVIVNYAILPAVTMNKLYMTVMVN
ncbi:MAG: phage tail sheath family protein [Eubacteriales bacterium]|nr:phage tail sheath family protein [Eubacteriales bacterium]